MKYFVQTPKEGKSELFKEIRTLRDYIVSEYSSIPEAKEIVERFAFSFCSWFDGESGPSTSLSITVPGGVAITDLHDSFHEEMTKESTVEDVEEEYEEFLDADEDSDNPIEDFYTNTKIYSKEVFIRYLQINPDVDYELTEDGEMYDYYVPDMDPDDVSVYDIDPEIVNNIRESDCDAEDFWDAILKNNNFGLYSTNNMSQLSDIEEEACDRVWFDRSSVGTDKEKPGTPEEIRQTALDNQKRIIEQYNLDPEKCDDFYHGYWSGILALSRYLSGNYSKSLEDLREGYDLLDT